MAGGLAIGYFVLNKPTTPSSEQHDLNSVEMKSVEEEQIWTCSMHPQVRQNEPGLCPICEMDLIPLEANTSNDPLVLQMTKEAIKLASIQTTFVGQSESSGGKTIRMTGKVQADERLASSQVAHVPGRIEKLYVTYTGEQVVKGQKLADLYSPDLISAQRELLEALKLSDLNPGLVDAARNKLRFWKIGDQEIKAVEKSGIVQETFPLHADETGIVTNRKVSVGDYVRQGESIFEMMNLNKVWVLFDAYEEDLASIKIGDKIEFTTPSIPQRKFSTRITFIDPVINPNTRVASLRTEVSNTSGKLKPEMLVYGTLTQYKSSKNQLTVPKSAVMWTGTRSVVYIKLPDMAIPSFQYREIEIGEALGNSYQLVSGIEEGEEIVVNGSFTIDAAAQLNNQASMMNKNVMVKGMDHTEHLPDFTDSTPSEFKQQLSKVSKSYIMLKDAMVLTDAAKASEVSAGFDESLANVDMSLVKGEAHMYWMEQLKSLQSHSNQIIGLKDIEEQRKQFDFLSQILIKSIKVFGTDADTFFVQHCPMAFDNKGADWISTETEIRNPYFGDKMMKCGLTQDTITKDYKNPPMQSVARAKLAGHNH